ncbi:hypothetical protein F1880_010339 [Penicillium rolfsii]|nr:hypothetical protein F1880_010339 [Penicillium rolfsii]
MKRKDAAAVGSCAPPAQILYRVTREGVADLRPAPLGKAGPWESLPSVSSAPLLQWTIHCGDIVIVDIGLRGEDFAKVSDLRRLPDGRYVVVYTWLYQRSEIAQELEINEQLSTHATVHLDTMWPLHAEYKFILSTNRTITIWDTAIGRAAKETTASICQYAIYSTTLKSRRIVSVDQPGFQWMREILLLKTEHEPDV